MSSSEWKEYTVQELVDLKMLDKPLDGNHGNIHPKSSDFVAAGVPFIMANDLKNGHVDYNKCNYITEKQAKTLRKGFAKPGDILLTHKATIGRTAIVDNKYKYIILTPQVTYYRPLNGIHNKYLKYYFDSKEFQDILFNWASSGSTRAYLSITEQRKLPVILPSLPEQKAIATTLSCLDDMIDLNNRINQVLEEMAQAIFKHWFVDFEFPNENGEPYKSNSGEMVDSELGEIPKGWRVNNIGDVCESISKKHNFDKDELIFLNTSDILAGQVLHNKYSKIDEMPGQAKKSIQNRDILFSEIRPANKRYAYVNFKGDDYVVSTKLMVLRANEKLINSRHLYHFLTSEKTLNILQTIAESRSGTFPQITFTNVSEIKIVLPPAEFEKEFGSILEILYENIDFNNMKNKKIADIRDILLPKLISGEIRVPVEEVG